MFFYPIISTDKGKLRELILLIIMIINQEEERRRKGGGLIIIDYIVFVGEKKSSSQVKAGLVYIRYFLLFFLLDLFAQLDFTNFSFFFIENLQVGVIIE